MVTIPEHFLGAKEAALHFYFTSVTQWFYILILQIRKTIAQRD
jgi:hypothetical protein